MTNNEQQSNTLKIVYVPVSDLIPYEKNPRVWSAEQKKNLKESIQAHGMVDPIIVNGAENRKNIVIGGHFRLETIKELGFAEAPVVYLNIPDVEQERKLNIRLNKALGEFDWDMLAEFGEEFLKDVGFSSEEMDSIFAVEDTPEQFDLEKELAKLDIKNIEIKKGDVWKIGDVKMMCGDSCIKEDMLTLMGEDKADLCLTDPPYILNYLKGKSRGANGPTLGFGAKKDRRYLETESLPDDFSDQWMANVALVQKPDFSIIIFENPKNLKTIWTALEKHWRYRNTITWFVSNRIQGFSAKYKFYNKTDIALVGTGGNVSLNLEPEEELFQNEYENAIFATSGKPHWEGYEKGKKICPTDFIEHTAGDKKSSGQEIIFGTKPLELLIPYLKVLTKRGDLVLEPFGGSGSTAAAAVTMGRRCNLMEKSPIYAEVIRRRLERLTGQKAIKIYERTAASDGR